MIQSHYHACSHRDRKTIEQAIRYAKDGDLRWFMTLNDVSVTTLITHWKPIEKSDEKKEYRDSISDVQTINFMNTYTKLLIIFIIQAQELLKRIDNRQLYHLVEEPVRFPKCNLRDNPVCYH